MAHCSLVEMPHGQQEGGASAGFGAAVLLGRSSACRRLAGPLRTCQPAQAGLFSTPLTLC